MEGRLRLAEKERQRLVKSKTGAPATAVAAGPSDEELKQLKAIADANMAALLQEEEVKKVCSHPSHPFQQSTLDGVTLFQLAFSVHLSPSKSDLWRRTPYGHRLLAPGSQSSLEPPTTPWRSF